MLVIPGALPSLNEIIETAKQHPMKYSSMKKHYTMLVSLSAKSQKLPTYERVNAVVMWICRDRRKDKDNIQAGQKFIWDGLVEAGVLTDDRWNQIGDVTHRFGVDKKNPRIEVELIEVLG